MAGETGGTTSRILNKLQYAAANKAATMTTADTGDLFLMSDISDDYEVKVMTLASLADEILTEALTLADLGITATAAEINYLDITTLGTGAASKAVVLDAGDDYTWPATGILTYGVLKDPAGTTLTATVAELNRTDITTAGTAEASKVVTTDANIRVTGLAGITSSVAGVVSGFFPTAVDQAINANGAINLTSYNTNVTSVITTGQAFTLAAGSVIGHRKRIQLIVDGADATVTFNTTATIVFADVGDVAELIWTGTIWSPIALFNCADGTTAPVYTAA